MKRVLSLLATLTVFTTVSASALPVVTSQSVGPVKCKSTDVTADMRVFPEPRVSGTFLSLSDFECGVFLLEDQYRDRITVDIIGRSASGHPIYDVKLTNKKIPDTEKRHLLVMSSIHGNEHAGREGGARVIEDMVDPRFLGREAWVKDTLDQYVVHITFNNPDGWVNGDIYGRNRAGVNYSRANNGPPPRDLNRNFPVQGFLRASNGTLDQPEGRSFNELLLRHADTARDVDDPEYRGWYLGTDNHGQGVKAVAASGLQIVGEFDFQKSERLAHFADGIEENMAEYGVLDAIQALNEATGGAIRTYEWGTLYDILGYSASGSGIDYYNTPTVVNGTGFATEMTASNLPFSNYATHPHLVNQMWVNTVRAINYTMFKDAVSPPSFTFPVGGRAAYVHDPAVVTHDDANGFGSGNTEIPSNFTGDDPQVEPDFQFRPYRVTRMKFFTDLNRHADNPLDALRVPDVLADPSVLDGYDSLVLNENPMPEGGDRAGWVAALRAFVEGGGNLVVTDAAAPIIADVVDGIETSAVAMARSNVGFVTFGDRSHPLNEGLRGIARQTYDVIPIGYPDGGGQAPNWRIASAAWTGAGGYTAGTNGTNQTIYGELPVGAGKITFLGALLPQPTEDFFHPYGLQNYAVTYTGYTLLENMLDYTRP